MTTRIPPGFNRAILLAVDDSENAGRAVEYVASLLGGQEGFQVTLLHVISEPEEDYFPSAEEKARWLEQYRERIQAVLEGYRDRLAKAGFQEDSIRILTPRRFCPSIGECILSELQKSGYATLVVGRKGISRKEEFLFGSVSSKIVGNAKDCTVWVVA